MRQSVPDPQYRVPKDWMSLLVYVVDELQPRAGIRCDEEGANLITPHFVMETDSRGKSDKGDEAEPRRPIAPALMG